MTDGTTSGLTAPPMDLASCHKLVARAAKLLSRAKAEPWDGRVACHREKCLDIRVSPEQLDRALRFMDSLLKTLEHRDLRFEITDVAKYDSSFNRIGDQTIEANATRVLVDEEWLTFGISEGRRTVQPQAPEGLSAKKLDEWKRWNRSRSLVPNGVLQLAIKNAVHQGIRAVWKDSKRRRIENCIDDFVAKLHVAAQALKDARAQREKARREWEVQQQRALEAQQRRMEEERRPREFQTQLDQWRLARDYRAFVEEARKIASDAGCQIIGQLTPSPPAG